jgi:CRISPR type IV-associated protein Csf3
MEPLVITARLAGGVSMPAGRIALDALLAAAVALRDELPPVSVAGVLPIEIPIAREPDGRFHLASFSTSEWETFEARFVNRRFPVAEAQALAVEKFKRIQISTGPCKSFRIPLETGHVASDLLTWWCVGTAGEIAGLLALVTHLGKRRGVGLGRVADWTVQSCKPWGEGFPVVREGRALRPLPVDWPGLVDAELGYACLSYPYWQRPQEVLCAVP